MALLKMSRKFLINYELSHAMSFIRDTGWKPVLLILQPQ